MLYREIIAVCSQIHTKHTNTQCGQNVELLDVKPGGTYSDHWVFIAATKRETDTSPFCARKRSSFATISQSELAKLGATADSH
jgi:hypothetical protein